MTTRVGLKEGQLANPLSKYRTYAYHHILIACDSTETGKSINKSLSSAPETFLPISIKEGESFAPNIADNGGAYVVLCNGLNGARFNIKEVKWETILAENYTLDDSTTVKTCGEQGTITIHEPIGVGFFNALAFTCDALQTDPSGVAYLLKTIFIGYTDDAVGFEFIYDIRPTFFFMQDINVEFDISGSLYEISVVGFADGYAKLPQINNIGSGITLKMPNSGTTLSDAMKLLEITLNDTYKKSIQKAIDAAKYNGCEALQLDNYRQIIYKIELPDVYQDSKYKIDNQLEAITDKGNGDSIFCFGEKANVEIIMNDILGACSTVQKESVGTVRPDGLITKYSPSVTSNVTSTKDNIIVTYSVHRFPETSKAFDIPPTVVQTLPDLKHNGLQVVMILPGGNQLLEDGSIFNPISGSRQPSDQIHRDQVAARLQQVRASQPTPVADLKPKDPPPKYNQDTNDKLAASNQTINFEYIFTGHNVDIQDFQMRMDIGIAFLQTLTIQGTMTNQDDTINNSVGSGTSRGAAGSVTKINKTDTIRPKSVLFYNPQSRDVYARHTKNAEATLSYRARLSNHAAYQNIEAVLNITGNPNLIAGTDPVTQTLDGGTRWNNVPQYCTVDIKYPDGDYPNSDKYNFTNFWYTGLYRILQIENIFSDGLFTQNLKLISLPVENPYDAKAGDAKDCFSAPNITTGPRIEAAATTSNINVSNNTVTVGGNTFQNTNDQTNFLLGSVLDGSNNQQTNKPNTPFDNSIPTKQETIDGATVIRVNPSNGNKLLSDGRIWLAGYPEIKKPVTGTPKQIAGLYNGVELGKNIKFTELTEADIPTVNKSPTIDTSVVTGGKVTAAATSSTPPVTTNPPEYIEGSKVVKVDKDTGNKLLANGKVYIKELDKVITANPEDIEFLFEPAAVLQRPTNALDVSKQTVSQRMKTFNNTGSN